ncbi:MAG: argininosuccinate lyase [Proteobacteria bacterium]|nr:argininosuccinate lyase [Pseudomonadota bacterium]
MSDEKPWGGRFNHPTDRLVEEFTASIQFDKRLYRYDIEGSIAYCRMLAKQGIISSEEEEKIVSGLENILKDIEAENFAWTPDLEDIHMAVEKALIDRIGKAGEKLHTGRSRNDQVSLDMRLYLRDEVEKTLDLISALKSSILKAAKNEIDIILPGYTHLQRAQPVLLSHYLLAYREMLDRDEARLKECYDRINIMPLGSAALAGTSLPIDRGYVAELLNFPKITKNSMDAVSDRDFVAEFIFDASLLMMHMSRFCEDLVIWSSGEFGFVEISDSFTTGSSIMPQKKNPDVAELIRGKTGRVYGNLVSLLTVMKGLPMSYNRDMQEDKEPLFDTVDTVKGCLHILSEMAGNLKFNRERMLEAAAGGFSTATDVADYLVMKGVPFRESHGIVGRLVGYCIEKDRELSALTIEEFRKFYSGFDEDIYRCLTAEDSVNSRSSYGGTAKKAVLKRIEEIEGEAKGKGLKAKGKM